MCEAAGLERGPARRPVRIDDAAWKITRGEQFGKLDRGKRAPLGVDRDHRIAADDRRGEPGDEAEDGGPQVTSNDPGLPALGTVKLEIRPATGSDELATCASLSAKPAYQTHRSIARSTLVAAGRELGELAGSRFHHLGDGRAPACGCRQVVPAHFACGLRVAVTASRASLRDGQGDVFALRSICPPT